MIEDNCAIAAKQSVEDVVAAAAAAPLQDAVMRNVKYMATCSYIGLDYSGFQTQILKGRRIPSIQDALQDALKKISKHETPIHTSSRTDQGVNALAHPIAFTISRSTLQTIMQPDIIKKSMNMHLKNAKHPISIENVYFVHPKEFNVKTCSLRKEYNYHLEANLQDNWANAFQVSRQAATIQEKIDVERMNEALQAFVGTHNFQNFTIKADHMNNFGCYVRTIDEIRIETYTHPFYEDAQCLKIIFIAKAFLAYQIRFMVGIAMLYSNKKIDKEYFLMLLDPPVELTPQEVSANLRIRAQPKGLILKRVDYPEGLLSKSLEEFYPEFAEQEKKMASEPKIQQNPTNQKKQAKKSLILDSQKSQPQLAETKEETIPN